VLQKIYRVMVVTLSLLSGPYFVKAATFTARASNNWNNYATTWGTATGPTASDIVIIPNGFTVTVNITTAAAASVTINGGGKLTLNNNDKLTIAGVLSNAGTITTNNGSNLLIGGSLINAGTMTVNNGSTVTFDGTANSTISSSGGTYTINGTIVMNMGAATTVLDVQDANFIAGINAGGKYYFTLTKGTFKMDNSGTLNNMYNSGSATALTIPYGVVLESDNGTMNLASKGTSGNVVLSGELYMNGGTVNVQTGQTSTQDFRYTVNGGTPQLYINSGTLNIGSGFNPKDNNDYIDFRMTGGTMAITTVNSSNYPTFQLQDYAGGKTYMSGGLILLDQPGNGPYNDLDMGGSAISPYSVTGGTVQFGGPGFPYNNAANFWIAPYSTTNYPNLVDDALNSASVLAETAGAVNALSLYINPGTTFDASNISTLNITGSNGAYALDNEGTFTMGNNTVEFSGGMAQVIKSLVSPMKFYNMQVANTGANVILDVATTITNQLSFSSGNVDASAASLTIANGSGAITGYGSSSYVITGDGVTNTGSLIIQKLTRSASSTFPIGTSSYYLPITVNPGNNNNTAYSAYVYPGVTTTAKSNGASVSSGTLKNMADVTWNIAQTAGSNSATLGLNWASAGTALEGQYFQTFGTAIGITQFTGGAWGPETGSGSEPAHTATATFSNVTQFSVVGTTAVILPLVLGDFNAAPQGKDVLLSWAAFPDGQTGSFTVQRSLDGSSWTDLGVVQADVLATLETSYSFIDAAPAAGQNAYRLFIQNEDGSISYSSIKLVEFSSAVSLNIYPNPANSSLTIGVGGAGLGSGSASASGSGLGSGSGSGSALAIRLLNTSGTVLQSKIVEAGVGTMTMNTGVYPAGVYYVEILEGGRLMQTTAVMVAH